jgi:hypothetical protein
MPCRGRDEKGLARLGTMDRNRDAGDLPGVEGVLGKRLERLSGKPWQALASLALDRISDVCEYG